MLSSKFIRENIDIVVKACHRRNFDFDVSRFSNLEKKRVELIQSSEEKKSLRNQVSKDIGQKKQQGQAIPPEEIAEMKKIGDDIERLDDELRKVMTELDHLCLEIPNLLTDRVPDGRDENDNELIRQIGEKTTFDFVAQDHVTLLEKNDWCDFPRAAKITGARFSILKKEAALLERALIHFLISENIKSGYEEWKPASIVNSRSLQNTGQLPKFKEDVFQLGGKFADFYLIPTAEVPLTNLFADEIIDEKDLPFRFTAHTPCFRSEAGSAGKDTRGLIRLHEFSKVELIEITKEEESPQAHEKMVAQAESLLKKLKIPYQVILLCAGDTGFSAQECYDIEAWLPGQNAYREVSSCSNCGAFQAGRAKIRYRTSDGSIKFAHTLNGSSLPVGRTMVAILENYQQSDGSIRIPQVLVPFMGKEIIGG